MATHPAPDTSPAAIARRIRECIAALGITERELGRRAAFASGNHVNTLLRRLDGGASVEVVTLVALSRATGRTLEWLATGAEPLCPACAARETRRAKRSG